MPIAQWNTTETPRDIPKEHSVVEEPGKHEIYDHRTTPLWSLDAFLEGAPWEVTFFAQRLGVNDTVKQLDINMPASNQSYDRYEKMELLVSNALSPAYNSETHEFTVSGVASIPSFFKPNVNDVFIAEANLGRLGLFQIKRVERLTTERESAHVIEYEIRKEITRDSPEYQDLHRKTVAPVYVYSKQRLIENKNPILVKETYEDVKNLRHTYLELANMYFKTFLAPYESIFILPGQESRIYDPYLTSFLMNLVSPRDVDNFPNFHALSINNDPNYDQPTVWTAMHHRGERSLDYVRKLMGTIRPGQFEQAYFGRSATYGNTDYIIYPRDIDTSMRSDTKFSYRVDNVCGGAVINPNEMHLKRSLNSAGTHTSQHDNKLTVGQREIPVYGSVADQSYYIFSYDFYTNQTAENLLEIAVLDYIRRAPISLWQLKRLVADYRKLERLDQFYYGPFLLALLKEADRGAYA